MRTLRASSLLPFIPSGSDFDASRRLFADLGFEERSASGDYATFTCGDAQFILQRFDVRSFAENLMMVLNVPDLDAWWEAAAQLRLEDKYPGVKMAAPRDNPWGREASFVDLAGVCWHVMTAPHSVNKQTVDRYMEAFRRGDHAAILDCLTDDVEWEVPGAFHIHGKDAFDREIENDAFVGRPVITVTRLVEEDDVVTSEGTVRTQRKDGTFLDLVFCDVFEMQAGRIRRLVSYLAQVVR